MRKGRVKTECKICGKKMEVFKSVIAKGHGKYCSRECANIAMVTKTTIPCEICGKPVVKHPSAPNRRFCSKDCVYISQVGHTNNPKTGKMVACEYCGKEVYIQKARVSKHHFCSNACTAQFYAPRQTGVNGPNYKGGLAVYRNTRTGKEYHLIRGLGKFQALHRSIVENVLGRPLETDEVVHHIDGDGLNNSNDNLLVCSNAYHSALHRKMEGGLREQA